MVGIGFFAPFPLALMIPFMAGQSLAMGEAFGKGFQYGKRKISSMSNEEFNKLDFQQLSESLATDYRMMIPSLVQSIKASDQLQKAVFSELGDLIKSIPDEILKFFADSTTSPTGISTVSYKGSVGIPLGPKAGSPEDQFGVVRDLGEKLISEVLPKTPQHLRKEKQSAKKKLIASESDFRGRSATVQNQIANAVNVTPKLYKGATSKRRKTQSSKKFEEKLKGLIRRWFTYINLYKNDPQRLKLGLIALRKTSQQLADWQFTYI